MYRIHRAAPLAYGNARNDTLLWFTGVTSQMIYRIYGRTLIELICGLVFSCHPRGLSVLSLLMGWQLLAAINKPAAFTELRPWPGKYLVHVRTIAKDCGSVCVSSDLHPWREGSRRAAGKGREVEVKGFVCPANTQRAHPGEDETSPALKCEISVTMSSMFPETLQVLSDRSLRQMRRSRRMGGSLSFPRFFFQRSPELTSSLWIITFFFE